MSYTTSRLWIGRTIDSLADLKLVLNGFDIPLTNELDVLTKQSGADDVQDALSLLDFPVMDVVYNNKTYSLQLSFEYELGPDADLPTLDNAHDMIIGFDISDVVGFGSTKPLDIWALTTMLGEINKKWISADILVWDRTY